VIEWIVDSWEVETNSYCRVRSKPCNNMSLVVEGDAAEPGKGYAEKAAEWQGKLNELNAETQKRENAESPESQNAETAKPQDDPDQTRCAPATNAPGVDPRSSLGVCPVRVL
jgi:hypothetical protein